MSKFEKLFTVKIKGAPGVNKEVAQISKAFQSATKIVKQYRTAMDSALKKQAGGQVKNITKQLLELKEATRGNLKLAKEMERQRKSGNTTATATVKVGQKLTVLEKERAALLAKNAKLHAKLTLAQSKEGQVIEQVNQRLLKQNAANKKQAKSIAGLLSPYEKLSADLGKLRKRWKDLAAAGKGETQQAKRLLSVVTKLDTKIKQIDKTVGQSQRNVGNYGSAISGLRSKFTNLAGAMGVSLGLFGAFRLIKNSISIVKDFEKQIAVLGGISRATTEELALLKEQAQELGATTEFTATQVAELQTSYARLGLSTSEIQAVTEATLQAATALQADLGETATLVGATLKGFGLDVDQTDKVVNSLAASTQRSALDFSKLQTALSSVAPVAKNAGVTLEETLGQLGTLVDRGLDASTAGTSLRNVYLELSKQGLTLEEALNKIATATDKNKVALELFGKRGATTGVILAENQEGFSNLTKEIDGAGDAARELAEKQLDTLDGSLKLLKSAWEGFILDMNEGSGAGNFLKDTIKLLAENLKVLLGVVGAVAVSYGIYRVQLALTNKQSFLSVAVSKLQAAATGKLNLATRAMAIGQRLLNSAMKANPILFVVGLVASLVAILARLYKSNAEVRAGMDALKRALFAVYDAFKPVISAVKEVVKVFSQTLAPLFKKFLNNFLLPFVNKGLKYLALQFRLVAGGISAFVAVFSFAFEQVKKIGSGFIQVVKGVFNLNKNGDIQKGIAKQVDGFRTLFKGLGKAAKDGFKEGYAGSTDTKASVTTKQSTENEITETFSPGGGAGGGDAAKTKAARDKAAAKAKARREKEARERQKQLDKEFADRAKLIARNRDEEIAAAKKHLDAVNADKRNSDLVKTEALLDFYDQKEEIEVAANAKLLANEKKYKKDSTDNEYQRQKELQKIQEEEAKVRATKQLSVLKDLEAEKNRNLTALELDFAQRRTDILNAGLTKKREAARLKQLAKVEANARKSYELKELDRILQLKKDLYAKGLISEQQYLDAKLLLQQKSNELLQVELEKETFSFRNNLQSFVTNIDTLLGEVGLQKYGQVISEGFAIAKQAMNDYYNNQAARIAQEKEERLGQIKLEQERLQADAQTAQEREFIDKQYQQKKTAIEKAASEKYKKIKRSELTISYVAELANIAVAAAANPSNSVTFGGAGIAQYALLAGLATGRFLLGLNSIKNATFEKGGLPSAGGNIGGNSHAAGGTPFVMGEAERNETAVITKGVQKNKKMSVSGTAHQILSAVNKSGGGVDFAPGAFLKQFEFGGYLGTQLNAPTLPEQSLGVSRGTFNTGGSENLMMEYIKATNARIDRMKVIVSSKEMTRVQDGNSKQAEVASIFNG